MKTIILCEPGFDGILTGLYWCLKIKASGLAVTADYIPRLDETSLFFESDYEISQKMQGRIKLRFGEDVLMKLAWAALSEDKDLGPYFYEFFTYVIANPERVLEKAYTDMQIFNIQKLARAVQREYHKMLGLVRFSEITTNTFYGVFEPQFNILEPLSMHFKERLSTQNWLLHDQKRSRICLFDGEFLTFRQVEALEVFKGQDQYESYWRTYYHAIAIEARINEKRRQGFMPKRYWAHLTELQS